MKRLIAISWILLPFVYGASAQVDDARKDAGVCARCHVISVAEWGFSKHRKTGTDCKACHGASQGHVIDERNNVKPDRIPRRAAVAKLCLSCHEDGCLKSKEMGSCQKCHHVHALLDPRKPLTIHDERLEQLEVRWQRYAQRMQEGERQIKARQWETARAAFQDALSEKPRDGTALARLKLCQRRMKPGLADFDIIGTTFDDVTGLPCQVRIVGLGIPMQLVSGGECDLGSDRFANTKPAHQVRVEPFYLARHELTQGEWKALMDFNPSAHQGRHFPDADKLPVEQVSWEDAQALVRALNDRVAGGGFRLPTEAEWEYAARAEGESGEAFSLAVPRAVEQGKPNRLGLFDLAGNVREWCSSRLVPYPYSASDGREATAESGLRVLRGGAFVEPSEWYEPAARHGERPTRRLPWNGLRLARSIPETTVPIAKPSEEKKSLPGVLEFSQVPTPVIPNAPAIFAEDRRGRTFLLIDTQPRTGLVWNGRELAKLSATAVAEVTLSRASREGMAWKSSVFPGQMTRDQHANGWRLAREPQTPQTSRIEIRPAGQDIWQPPLDLEAVTPQEYQTMVADEVGYVWISTRKNVLCLDPRKPTNGWTWTAPQPVTAFGLSPNGRALAGLANGELYELGRGPKGSGISQPYTVRELPAKPIRAIHTDGDGSVWVVVETAVFRAAPPADAWQRHWRALARMPVSNHDIFSGQLDGKLYVFGGMANFGYPAKYTYFNDLFMFDTAANHWEIISRLDPPRAYNGCVALAGRLWVIGGRLLDKEPVPIDRVDIYDPKTGRWEAGPTLPTPRSEAVVLPVNDRIYVVGGLSGKAEPQTYDTLSIGPDEPAWRKEPAPPGGQVSQSSGGVIAGRIYLVAPQARSVLRYDTVVRTWDKLPSPPSEITLWAAVCGAYKGEFWVMGGNTDKKLTFIYSPRSNTWRSGPNLPTPLGWTSAQAVDGRFILTPGGIATPQLDDFIFTDAVYELRPASEPEGKP